MNRHVAQSGYESHDLSLAVLLSAVLVVDQPKEIRK